MRKKAESRKKAHYTWTLIKGYVRENGKESKFDSLNLRTIGGEDYSSRSLTRLLRRGLIRIVDKHSNRRAIYMLGEGILALSIEDIMSLDYNAATSKSLYK